MLREYSPSLAVVAQAGTMLQQPFAYMVNKRNPSVVVAIRETFLFVKNVGAFPLLWGLSRYL